MWSCAWLDTEETRRSFSISTIIIQPATTAYTSTIAVPRANDNKFDLPLDNASFERSGNELIVIDKEGTRIVFADFFAQELNGSLPALAFADGTVVAAKIYLFLIAQQTSLYD